MVGAPTMKKWDRERATRRIRAYFAKIKKRKMPIEEAVQEIVSRVGCDRETVYKWKNPEKDRLVSRAYCVAVEAAIDDLEKDLEDS